MESVCVHSDHGGVQLRLPTVVMGDSLQVCGVMGWTWPNFVSACNNVYRFRLFI